MLSAKAGTPIAEIEKLVAEKGQELAFEPPITGRSSGCLRAPARIGGVLAANLSGPRRVKAGAARDHFLGVTAVSGRGETFKSGGRVVKNVTGYDLCKLLAGLLRHARGDDRCHDQDVAARETEATLIVAGLDGASRRGAMAEAMGSSCDVSGAAHLPGHVTRHFDGLHSAMAVTVFRLEGVKPSVSHRTDMLAALLKPFGAVEVIAEKHSREIWRGIRDAAPFAATGDAMSVRSGGSRPRREKASNCRTTISPGAQMFSTGAGD